jgi:predicted Zn-dependent protease
MKLMNSILKEKSRNHPQVSASKTTKTFEHFYESQMQFEAKKILKQQLSMERKDDEEEKTLKLRYSLL